MTTSAADRGVTATIARAGGRLSGSFDIAGPQATPRYPASWLGSVMTRSAPRAPSRAAATLSAISVKTVSRSHDLLLEQTALLKDYARIGSRLPPKTSLAVSPRALSLRAGSLLFPLRSVTLACYLSLRKTSARFLCAGVYARGRTNLPKVTEEHERKRREQILAAAMECFARNGYRTTSIEDIVRESKLSVGAIYSYFPSKQDLFLALAEQRTTETLEAFRAVYERPGSMAEKNRDAVELFFQQMSAELAPYCRVSFEFWSEAPKSDALQA